MSPTQDRQGEDLGQGLCASVWLSPHLCITDALGTNQYMGLWHSCQNPAGSHGCSVTTSPLPLVVGREKLWGILE